LTSWAELIICITAWQAEFPWEENWGP
jgi:hypothetical protein